MFRINFPKSLGTHQRLTPTLWACMKEKDLHLGKDRKMVFQLALIPSPPALLSSALGQIPAHMIRTAGQASERRA